MLEKNEGQIQDEDSTAFNRRFKYAVYVYAIIEFIALALVIYYKTYR
ncbi:MAG: hypothetical protein H0V27_02260 [Pyrinomonadaceae bacterium]|nr:hypothetical protein [Pyrinomonadaceae bacterium]